MDMSESSPPIILVPSSPEPQQAYLGHSHPIKPATKAPPSARPSGHIFHTGTPLVLVPETPPPDDIHSWTSHSNPKGMDNPTLDTKADDKLAGQALSVLQKVLCKPNADWTCPEQRAAMLAVLKLKTDVLVIIKTGGGKTMLPIIASLMERNYITVVVLPLKSLMADYRRKLDDMQIPYEVFLGRKSRQLQGEHNLVLVSADVAKKGHWRQCLAELNERKRVVRTFWDEGQFSFTGNDFRLSLQDLDELRSIPMQFVILSGSIPTKSEDVVCESFALGSNTLILRTETDRPELEYILEPKQPSSQQVVGQVQAIFQHHVPKFQRKDRVLVFVPYIDQGIRIAEALGCQFYNGNKDTSDTEHQEMYDSWINGTYIVMVCTSSFGCGNDYSSVRLVIHAGSPHCMIDYR
jgi:superfamily II DNA helicase RecQ